MKFRKLISLGVVSAMVSTMASSVFAVEDITDSNNKVGKLLPFVIEGTSNTLKTVGKSDLVQSETINGTTFTNFIKLTGSNTDSRKIYFGISNDALFGTGTSSTKPKNQKVILAPTNGAIKKTASGEFSNRGVTVETKKEKVITATGEYSGAYCVLVKFTNTSSSDQYSAWDITLTGADGSSSQTFKLVTVANAMDATDVSKAEVDVTEDGYREYADNTALKNGAIVTVAELKAMLGQGSYKFTGSTGVDILSSVSQATLNEGRATYNVTLGTDAVLNSRYNAEGTGKVFKLSIPFFKNENRKINIDCDNQKVIDLFGTDLADKLVNGTTRRLYVYPINASGYETLAKASANDGIINTDEVISATVSDSKIVFDMKKGVTDVMISTKEIDTTKLPAVAGVSVSEEATTTTSGAENEIVAPVISEEATADSTTSSSAPVLVSEETEKAPVVNAPALEEAPAATNAGQQNTGANDVVVLAIVLAVISMAAAGVVASKKF